VCLLWARGSLCYVVLMLPAEGLENEKRRAGRELVKPIESEVGEGAATTDC
jgi:hypothetical protein